MRGQYLAAIKATNEHGQITEGNKAFFTEGEKLTMKHLDKVRVLFCNECAVNGFKCKPENTVIYAVIPLDD